MNKELKRKWIKALRSGEYEQGKDYLFAGGAYCCLGVLGSVMGASNVSMNHIGLLVDVENLEPSLPCGIQDELANLNDEGVPFDMIAGLIDEAL